MLEAKSELLGVRVVDCVVDTELLPEEECVVAECEGKVVLDGEGDEIPEEVLVGVDVGM